MPAQANQPLPEGFELLDYRIARLLASGGFSFVYLAHDPNDAPVAIKEYLPASLALRRGDDPVPQVAEENLATFRYGLKCFLEEARTLAALSHPNVVRAVNFFRANETVYMVMRYERGRTLQEHIQACNGAVKEGWVRRTFVPLLNGLRAVHARGLVHFDIKPGNVYLRNDGTPLLLDFGASRELLSAEGLKLPPMYTPGFASPEHHRDRGQLGPWSDIYSVGATLYACLGNAAPCPADQRLEKDRLVPARKAWAGKFSRELLETIDWCLRLDPRERPQSPVTLKKALLGERQPERHGEPPVLDQLKGLLLRLARR